MNEQLAPVCLPSMLVTCAPEVQEVCVWDECFLSPTQSTSWDSDASLLAASDNRVGLCWALGWAPEKSHIYLRFNFKSLYEIQTTSMYSQKRQRTMQSVAFK